MGYLLWPKIPILGQSIAYGSCIFGYEFENEKFELIVFKLITPKYSVMIIDQAHKYLIR